jgi:hypothetical protein
MGNIYTSRIWTIFQAAGKCLIYKGLEILALQHESPVRASPQSENIVPRSLSTKLSPGSVDKGRKSLVYRDLGDLLMFYLNFLLRCMIF